MSEEGEEAMHGRRGLCIRDKVGLPKKEAADVDSDEERVHDTESEVKQMLAELEEEAAALQRDNEVESLSPRRRQKVGLSGLLSGMMRKGPTPFEPKKQIQMRRESLELDKTLGEGSCAIVCSATWHGKRVAAKLLKDEAQYRKKGSTLDEARETLLKEIEMLGKFNHPHMVSVVGTCDEHGAMPVLVQELMECSLKQYYDKKNAGAATGAKVWRPDEYTALRWCWGLAQAVSFLHSLTPCIVHRDIKPDNIMLDAENNLKVGDLGLSRQIPKKSRGFMGSKKKQSYRMTGDTGSLRYMAPEVLDVDQEGMAFYSEAVDVYSSAMVMFFIIAGEIPFVAHRAREAAKRAILGFRPSLKHLASEAPMELLSIIKACWAHEHVDRPGMEEVAVKLSELKHLTHERKANALIEKITEEGGEDAVTAAARARSLSVCNSPISRASRSSSPVRNSSPTTRGSKSRWPFGAQRTESGGEESQGASNTKAKSSTSLLDRAKNLSRSVSPFRRSKTNSERDGSKSPARGAAGERPSTNRLSSPIHDAPAEGGSPLNVGSDNSWEGGPAGSGRSGRESRRKLPTSNAPKERLSSGL